MVVSGDYLSVQPISKRIDPRSYQCMEYSYKEPSVRPCFRVSLHLSANLRASVTPSFSRLRLLFRPTIADHSASTSHEASHLSPFHGLLGPRPVYLFRPTPVVVLRSDVRRQRTNRILRFAVSSLHSLCSSTSARTEMVPHLGLLRVHALGCRSGL